MSARTVRRRRARGFTLVELMVALTGGLFVTLAVFALARDSGRFYQRESRVANATVGALLGFERLRMDVARAGYLVTPNIVRDPAVCSRPSPAWPSMLLNLASISIASSTTSGGALATNNRTPPTVTLAGAYSSTDMFTAQVVPNGNNTDFMITLGSPALLRLGNGTNPDDATMQTLFAAGRALRFVQYGVQYYGTILSANGGTSPKVTVNGNPPLQMRSGSGVGCGIEIIGSGVGRGTINIVNFIQYSLRNLSASPQGVPGAQTTTATNAYASLYSNSAAGPGEAGRTELVRVELNDAGNPMADTEELVAEYAVDLDFQITAVTALTGCCDPTVTSVPSTSTSFATFTGLASTAGSTPELIRTVRTRLGVRSREGDRPAGVADDTGATQARGIFRFNVGDNTTADSFARVRTFQADVALYNQLDVLW